MSSQVLSKYFLHFYSTLSSAIVGQQYAHQQYVLQADRLILCRITFNSIKMYKKI